jgi:hypothetical protein
VHAREDAGGLEEWGKEGSRGKMSTAAKEGIAPNSAFPPTAISPSPSTHPTQPTYLQINMAVKVGINGFGSYLLSLRADGLFEEGPC